MYGALAAAHRVQYGIIIKYVFTVAILLYT